MIQHNAPHPGELVREQMGEMRVIDFAQHLGVTRVTLSRLLNGQAGMSASMATRLAQAWPNTDARFWLTLQLNYELSQAAQAEVPGIAPLRTPEVRIFQREVELRPEAANEEAVVGKISRVVEEVLIGRQSDVATRDFATSAKLRNDGK